MNIAFLFETPIRQNSGGIERVTMLLSQQFKLMGHNVSFISTSIPGADETVTQTTFEQICIDGSAATAAGQITKAIKELNVDVVINQSVIFSTLKLLPTIKKTGVIIITVLHNRPFSIVGFEKFILNHTHPLSAKEKILKWGATLLPSFYNSFRKSQECGIYRTIVKYSDKFMLLSDNFIPRIHRFCSDLDLTKIGAINNPNTFNLPEGATFVKENVVLFVGRLVDPQKNVMGFIDVWNTFSRQFPDWKAIIVGDGPHRKIFENYAAKTNAERLTFVGNQKDVARYYAMAKFLCMTSPYEGWPMVLAEALAHGCIPFVYDTFESCHEILSNETGRIITPFNHLMMAEQMKHIASDIQLTQQMSKAAASSTHKYAPGIIANRWIDEISRLISETVSK